MATLTVTAAKVGFLDSDVLLEKITGPAGETITAGQVVRRSVTSGKFIVAAGGAAAAARGCGIATRSAETGVTLTAVRKGLVDLGNALSSLTYDDVVYLSDTTGKMSDTAGTVSLVVGTVEPIWGHTTADKLLRVDL